MEVELDVQAFGLPLAEALLRALRVVGVVEKLRGRKGQQQRIAQELLGTVTLEDREIAGLVVLLGRGQRGNPLGEKDGYGAPPADV